MNIKGQRAAAPYPSLAASQQVSSSEVDTQPHGRCPHVAHILLHHLTASLPRVASSLSFA
jgi:hypothetical protein